MRRIKKKDLLADDTKAVLNEKEQKIFNNFLNKMSYKSQNITKDSKIGKILEKLIENNIFVKEAQNYEKLNRRVLKEISNGIIKTLKKNGFNILAKKYGEMMNDYPEIQIFSPQYWIMNVLDLTERDVAMFHLGEILLYLKSKGMQPDAKESDMWPMNEDKFKEIRSDA